MRGGRHLLDCRACSRHTTAVVPALVAGTHSSSRSMIVGHFHTLSPVGPRDKPRDDSGDYASNDYDRQCGRYAASFTRAWSFLPAHILSPPSGPGSSTPPVCSPWAPASVFEP